MKEMGLVESKKGVFSLDFTFHYHLEYVARHGLVVVHRSVDQTVRAVTDRLDMMLLNILQGRSGRLLWWGKPPVNDLVAEVPEKSSAGTSCLADVELVSQSELVMKVNFLGLAWY